MKNSFLEQKKVLSDRLGKKIRQRVLVGVSGGVDSMTLYHWLATYCRDLLDPLAVYFDHGQRIESETQKDWELIQELSAKLGVSDPLRFSLGLEENASEAQMRKLRFATFENVCRDRGTNLLFLGHHFDDQVETYLFKLLRGSHPTTIRAMDFCTSRGPLILFRPFLALKKSELIGYANQHNISWNEDLTNKNINYCRNQIRNDLIPTLEKIRPRSTEKIAAFFSTLVEIREKSEKTRTDIKDHSINLLEGTRVQHLDFESLKQAVQTLLGETQARTGAFQWNTLRKILTSRKATKTGGGPRKLVQFPGGGCLIFEGPHVRWKSKIFAETFKERRSPS